MKRYDFRTATGASCCASDNIKYLCEHCRAAALEANADYSAPNPYHALMAAAPPPVEIVRDAHGVPRPYAPRKETR